MLKYVFSGVLVAAVWATVLVLELPIALAIAATSVIALVLIAIVVTRAIRARTAARAIERALRAQADAAARMARPDLQAEVSALQSEFVKAVSALKASKLGRKSGRDALYALPWYLLIGPPGAGKSTALRTSGLRFPYLSRSGGGVQGLGGTRNCEWWMTNEAVILDTAGRYTTEESDRDEWLAFLDLLKKNRPKRPLNGLLVAIPILDVADADLENARNRAREVRARIDEVMGKLEMVIPVYFMFTKCDLLPGFVETNADLATDERNQIWGFTLPVSRQGEAAHAFTDHFRELAGLTAARALRRMADERSADARTRIHRFPHHFEATCDPLAAFVAEVMAPSIYSETPIFRGVYFTSGTQEGRPIDRVMDAMAEAFGVAPRKAHAPPVQAAKSYFLGDVFRKVIFADQNVATIASGRLRRQAWIGHALAFGLVVVAVGLTLLPLRSFHRNRELTGRVATAVALIADHNERDQAEPIPLAEIDPLRRVERELTAADEDGAPWALRMGMYQGDKISGAVRQLYYQTARRELVQPLVALELRRLEDFVRTYAPVRDEPRAQEHAENRARLRAYLLLSGPRADGEPGVSAAQAPWLARYIAAAWARPLKLASDVATLEAMNEVALTYAEILRTSPSLLFKRDERLVADVRAILRRTDRTEVLLAELLGEVTAPDVDLRTLSDSNVALKNEARVVRGAYTREAWEKTVRARLARPFEALPDDEWVLGRTPEESQTSQHDRLAALRSLYFENYIAEWKGFVASIYMVMPGDYLEAQSILDDLTHGATPPLGRLCQYIDWHTTLVDAPDSTTTPSEVAAAALAGSTALAKSDGAGQAAAGVGQALLAGEGDRANRSPLKTALDVRAEFEGLARFGYIPAPQPVEGQTPPPPAARPLDRYQEELARVRDALRAKIDHGGPENTDALVNAVKTALTTVEGLINETDTKGWHSTEVRLLPLPFKGVWEIVGQSVEETMSQSWCEQVYKPLTTKILPRRPFSANGRELSRELFSEVFKPDDGKIWAYYREALTARVPRLSTSYTLAKTGAAERSRINPQVVAFLNRADDLGQVMFPVSGDLRLDLDVWIDDNPAAAETRLAVDGAKIVHRNGPGRWQRISWPGTGDRTGVELVAIGKGVRGSVAREGAWGLFELFAEGTLKSGSARSDVFVFQWDLTDEEAGIVTIKFRPLEASNPFFGVHERPTDFLELLRHPDLVKPPAQLLVGGRSCP